jgi:hypothetical protein
VSPGPWARLPERKCARAAAVAARARDVLHAVGVRRHAGR